MPVYASKDALVEHLLTALKPLNPQNLDAPFGIVIGAKGRVGSGAADLLSALNLNATLWDMEETKHGGPFPEILDHTLFINCILAGPKVPVFVSTHGLDITRKLRVIADVSCDPNSSYNPIPIYDHSTTFAEPLVRVRGGDNPLDVMAIDNLPTMLPVESSQDFAGQLLPFLMGIDDMETGVWGRAATTFKEHVSHV